MRGAKHKFYRKTKPLSKSLEDFLFTERQVSENPRKLVGFVAVQIFHYGKEPHQIIKYDTAHGIYNAHKYYQSLDEKEEFPEEQITDTLFEAAKKDILENWEKYKDFYVGKWLERQ